MTDVPSLRPDVVADDPDVPAIVPSSAGQVGGIPDHLGIGTTQVGPGTMTAAFDVRREMPATVTINASEAPA